MRFRHDSDEPRVGASLSICAIVDDSSVILTFCVFLFQGSVADVFRLSLFYPSYALIVTQFILFCFAERSPLADSVNDKVTV